MPTAIQQCANVPEDLVEREVHAYLVRFAGFPSNILAERKRLAVAFRAIAPASDASDRILKIVLGEGASRVSLA